MKTTNEHILATKRDYQLVCKDCDWTMTYLHSTYWKVERMMEMIIVMPKVPGTCEHSLEIKELR